MSTLKICVQKRRKDGFWPVYIRVTHRGKQAFIKTQKMVSDKGLSKTKQVKDPFVVAELSQVIVDYMDRLNRQDTSMWDVKQVVEFLTTGDSDVSFSEYARLHYARMIDAGQLRTAKNYKMAYQHLERFAGTTKLMFSAMTSAFINRWIKSLDQHARAKEMYPVCVRQIFKAALLEYNDHDAGIIRIKTNPWVKVSIPAADTPQKLAITPEECRAFFSAPLPDSPLKVPREELGRDVAMMVFCLAGMNTVDIFNLRKEDYADGLITYERAKTKKFRADRAKMVMRVPDIIKPLFTKYAAKPGDPWLFNFHDRFSSSDSFGSNVNGGIKRICESMGMRQQDWYCVYTFRHTWGTIAQNDCGATEAEVGFAMNHSTAHRVTRGYLKVDYSPAWRLNEKVIEFVFFTDQAGSRNEAQDDGLFRISPKMMVKGTAYFQGRKVGELQDTGYSNVNEVMADLVKQLPDDIPPRSMVQFKIERLDGDRKSVCYERMKGKGFS